MCRNAEEIRVVQDHVCALRAPKILCFRPRPHTPNLRISARTNRQFEAGAFGTLGDVSNVCDEKMNVRICPEFNTFVLPPSHSRNLHNSRGARQNKEMLCN